MKGIDVSSYQGSIDWSKVNSISGQTYNLRDAAKSAGLKWDSAEKKWKRKK